MSGPRQPYRTKLALMTDPRTSPPPSWPPPLQPKSAPTDFRSTGNGEPAISTATALLLPITFAAAYIVPFYLSPAQRATATLSRDHPASIRARSRAVLLVSCLCAAVTCAVLTLAAALPPRDILRLLGLYPASLLIDTSRTLLLLALLFAGPLFERLLVVDGGGGELPFRAVARFTRDLLQGEPDWVACRNLVVGPVSEEFIFRSLAVALLLTANAPATAIVWQAPLLFGVAHAHHFNEYIVAHKGMAEGGSYLGALATPGIVLPALLRTAFQLGFTTVFGMFVTFVFLRTGNVYSCVLAHTFCNWMGLPRVWGLVGDEDDDKVLEQWRQQQQQQQDRRTRMDTTPAAAARTQELDQLSGVSAGGNVATASGRAHGGQSSHGRRVFLSAIYYALLVSGAWAFKKSLWSLTESELALAQL